MHFRVIVAATAALLAAPVAAQVPVTIASNNANPTTLGAIIAGQSYHVAATGTSDLFAGYSSGNGLGTGLTFTADGIPTYNFGGNYAAFYPNGLDHDPSSNTLCVGGAGVLCGALIGGFVSVPGGATTYFQIGSSFDFVAPISGFLVGLVNDVGAYNDNAATGFIVTLAPQVAGVPEPSTWAMMIMGFGLIGAGLRSRSKLRTNVSFG